MKPQLERLEERTNPAVHILAVYLDPWTLSLDRYQAAQAAIAVVDQYHLRVRLREVFNPAKAQVFVGVEQPLPGYFWDGEEMQNGAEQQWLISEVDWPNYWSTAPVTPANRNDFESGVLHELGHVLGLNESSDPKSATYWIAQPGVQTRSFDAADLALVQALWRSPNAHPELG